MKKKKKKKILIRRMTAVVDAWHCRRRHWVSLCSLQTTAINIFCILSLCTLCYDLMNMLLAARGENLFYNEQKAIIIAVTHPTNRGLLS